DQYFHAFPRLTLRAIGSPHTPAAILLVIYWITLAARPSSDRGMVNPRALTCLRLMTSSNLGRLLDRQVGQLGAFEAGRRCLMAKSMNRVLQVSSEEHFYISYAVFCLQKNKARRTHAVSD